MQGEQDRNKSDMAIKWLRDHFAGDPEPRIRILWDDEPASEEAIQGIMDILFRVTPGGARNSD